VGVWVGNFDGAPMQRVSGVTGAAPLLHAVVTHLHERFGTSWYERPAGIVDAMVDARTGRRVSEGFPGAVPEKFLAGSLPPESAPDDFDEQGRVRLGAEYQDWWRDGGAALAGRFNLRDAAKAGPLRILSPLPGTTFYLDPDLPAGGRRIRVRARGGGTLRWECGSLALRGEGPDSQAELTEGRHQLVLRDANSGRTAMTWIEVRRL
jgi:penicillin-binding protein 1C